MSNCEITNDLCDPDAYYCRWAGMFLIEPTSDCENFRDPSTKTKKVRRWRFWACFQGEDRERKAREEIKAIELEGCKAKIWAPLPQHKTSGHTHIVVLCTLYEKLELAGIPKREV